MPDIESMIQLEQVKNKVLLRKLLLQQELQYALNAEFGKRTCNIFKVILQNLHCFLLQTIKRSVTFGANENKTNWLFHLANFESSYLLFMPSRHNEHLADVNQIKASLCRLAYCHICMEHFALHIDNLLEMFNEFRCQTTQSMQLLR